MCSIRNFLTPCHHQSRSCHCICRIVVIICPFCDWEVLTYFHIQGDMWEQLERGVADIGVGEEANIFLLGLFEGGRSWGEQYERCNQQEGGGGEVIVKSSSQTVDCLLTLLESTVQRTTPCWSVSISVLSSLWETILRSVLASGLVFGLLNDFSHKTWGTNSDFPIISNFPLNKKR